MSTLEDELSELKEAVQEFIQKIEQSKGNLQLFPANKLSVTSLLDPLDEELPEIDKKQDISYASSIIHSLHHQLSDEKKSHALSKSRIISLQAQLAKKDAEIAKRLAPVYGSSTPDRLESVLHHTVARNKKLEGEVKVLARKLDHAKSITPRIQRNSRAYHDIDDEIKHLAGQIERFKLEREEFGRLVDSRRRPEKEEDDVFSPPSTSLQSHQATFDHAEIESQIKHLATQIDAFEDERIKVIQSLKKAEDSFSVFPEQSRNGLSKFGEEAGKFDELHDEVHYLEMKVEEFKQEREELERMVMERRPATGGNEDETSDGEADNQSTRPESSSPHQPPSDTSFPISPSFSLSFQPPVASSPAKPDVSRRYQERLRESEMRRRQPKDENASEQKRTKDEKENVTPPESPQSILVMYPGTPRKKRKREKEEVLDSVKLGGQKKYVHMGVQTPREWIQKLATSRRTSLDKGNESRDVGVSADLSISHPNLEEYHPAQVEGWQKHEREEDWIHPEHHYIPQEHHTGNFNYSSFPSYPNISTSTPPARPSAPTPRRGAGVSEPSSASLSQSVVDLKDEPSAHLKEPTDSTETASENGEKSMEIATTPLLTQPTLLVTSPATFEGSFNASESNQVPHAVAERDLDHERDGEEGEFGDLLMADEPTIRASTPLTRMPTRTGSLTSSDESRMQLRTPELLILRSREDEDDEARSQQEEDEGFEGPREAGSSQEVDEELSGEVSRSDSVRELDASRSLEYPFNLNPYPIYPGDTSSMFMSMELDLQGMQMGQQILFDVDDESRIEEVDDEEGMSRTEEGVSRGGESSIQEMGGLSIVTEDDEYEGETIEESMG